MTQDATLSLSAHLHVRWESDGSYTPTCPTCAWEGKVRWQHAQAVQAVRQHRQSQAHLANLRAHAGAEARQ